MFKKIKKYKKKIWFAFWKKVQKTGKNVFTYSETTIMKKIRNDIINSKSGKPFGKQAMLYLLENSNNLTQPVGLAIEPTKRKNQGTWYGRGRQFIYSIHDIKKVNFRIPGLDWGFQSCYDSIQGGRMFGWLAPSDMHPANNKIKILKVDWKKIHSISLEPN